MRRRIWLGALFVCALVISLPSQVAAQDVRQAVTGLADALENGAVQPTASPMESDQSHEQVAYQEFAESYPSGGSEYVVSDHECMGGGCANCSGGYCGPGTGDCGNGYCGGGGCAYCGGGGCDYCSGGYCDPNMAGCDPFYAPYGCAAGVEATYLKPELEHGGPLGPFGDYDYEAAPRIWLHWQAPNGAGVRARYWSMDAEQQRTTIVDLGNTLRAQTFDDDLEAYAIDLELTRAFTAFHTYCLASLGARHARLNRHATRQRTDFDLDDLGADDASTFLQTVDRGMKGTGITSALDMRHPIMQSRLAAVCNLRGSFIWGDNELDHSGTVIEVVPIGLDDLNLNDFDTFRFSGNNGRGMWIGEIQAGGEWNTPLSSAYGGGNAFIRLLFEAQWWHLPEVSTRFGPDADSQLHEFFGITAAAGFTR